MTKWQKLSALFLLAASPAFALDGGIYFLGGGGFGFYEDAEDDARLLDSEAVASGFSTSKTEVDDGLGFKLGGGWRFNEYVAVELSYLDMGTTKLNTRTTGPTTSFTTEIQTNAVNASVVGIIPISKRVHLLGRLGIASWNSDISVRVFSSSIPIVDQSGTDFSFGFGVGVRFGDNFTLAVDIDRFTADLGAEGKLPYSLLTVGGRIGF